MTRQALKNALRRYRPWNEQEEADRAVMLRLLQQPDIFLRRNQAAHFSASGWIVDAARQRTLMAYHRIYNAWAWTGGHADGETELLAVALREAQEETGVHARPVSPEIFSLEILTVDGHEKRGVYVPSHLHLNVTYLLEADPTEPIRAKADENAAVRWFSLGEALESCAEEWMVRRVYSKLNEKLACFPADNQPGETAQRRPLAGAR